MKMSEGMRPIWDNDISEGEEEEEEEEEGEEEEFGKYEGELKDNKPHGYGTYTWSNGTKYEGQYKFGEITGKGTKTYPDGSKFAGFWKDGVRWSGTLYGEDGTPIIKFVSGKME
jgi:hypothetical protein